MKTLTSNALARFAPTACLLVILVLLSACGGDNNAGSVTPTPRATSTSGGGIGGSGTATPTLSATASIQLGQQPCPAPVKDPTHWDAIIPTQANVTSVDTVACGYLTGKASLQALVTVLHAGTGMVVDVYVYDNIAAPNPVQLFKLPGLYKGNAKISNYNTVITAEVDSNSSINTGKPNALLEPDLFREFATGSFAPVSFPGFFPDLTRYQAELDQGQVNQGQNAWELDPLQVASHFDSNQQMLNWTNFTSALVSGGGSGDQQAVVNVKNSGHAGAGVTLTMQRLEGNTNGGIWEITAVATGGMAITAPQSRDTLTTPVTVSGSGTAFEGVIGPVIVLDHTYSAIGHTTAMGTGNGPTTFSASVPYSSTFKTGKQDGILVLYATNNASGGYAGAVMLKELL
ncbi:MAG TPA: Gmad2 immunoglobulin-like domain-containing protein [Ktedonobacteraceae bacterium]|nr:Gmad2 immunoglobulin-like domain-containing protein [Ktedonobacteraceae bacterium]